MNMLEGLICGDWILSLRERTWCKLRLILEESNVVTARDQKNLVKYDERAIRRPTTSHNHLWRP